MTILLLHYSEKILLNYVQFFNLLCWFLLTSVNLCKQVCFRKKKILVQHHSLISAIEDLPSTSQYVIIITNFSKKKKKR